jgi:hypothetical protein
MGGRKLLFNLFIAGDYYAVNLHIPRCGSAASGFNNPVQKLIADRFSGIAADCCAPCKNILNVLH